MLRCIRLMLAFGADEASPMEDAQGLLDRALRQSSLLGNLAMAEPHSLLAYPVRAPPEEEIDQERGRAVIVAHEVTKENVDNIVVDAKRAHRAIVVITIARFKRLYGLDPAR
jgi:hypothetical protein